MRRTIRTIRPLRTIRTIRSPSPLCGATLVALAASACFAEPDPAAVFACERDEDCVAGDVCRETSAHPDRPICVPPALDDAVVADTTTDATSPDASSSDADAASDLDARRDATPEIAPVDGDARDAPDADAASDAMATAPTDATTGPRDDSAAVDVDAAGDADTPADAAPALPDLEGGWRGHFHTDGGRLFLWIAQAGFDVSAKVSGGAFGDWNDETCEGTFDGDLLSCSYAYTDMNDVAWTVEAHLAWSEATQQLSGTWRNQKFPWLDDQITFIRYEPE